jgi:stress-induced morphogen
MLSLPARQAVRHGSRSVLFQGARPTFLASRLSSSSRYAGNSRASPLPPRLSCTPRSNQFSTSSNARQAEEQEQEQEMNDGEKNIHDILTREFQPVTLQVQDVSGESSCTFLERRASSNLHLQVAADPFMPLSLHRVNSMVNQLSKRIV